MNTYLPEHMLLYIIVDLNELVNDLVNTFLCGYCRILKSSVGKRKMIWSTSVTLNGTCHLLEWDQDIDKKAIFVFQHTYEHKKRG
jgi:hypothetical protein